MVVVSFIRAITMFAILHLVDKGLFDNDIGFT